MKEYKFRGKRLDMNAEYVVDKWVYGDIRHESRGIMICGPHIRAFVDPETIGQYCFLKDTDGREIYEGDIVKVERERDEIWHEIVLVKDIRELPREFFGSSVNWRRVLGNIHDNPDLYRTAQ